MVHVHGAESALFKFPKPRAVSSRRVLKAANRSFKGSEEQIDIARAGENILISKGEKKDRRRRRASGARAAVRLKPFQ